MLSTSCKSVQKLVDSGDYDSAIELATRKMRGDKIKKRKHIIALERAFANVNQNDIEEISFLRDKDDIGAHERILDILNDIEYRQRLIDPYLPLISKDGYRGDFEFVKTQSIYSISAQRLTVLSYEKGLRLLELSKSENSPRHARRAFSAFTRVADFNEDYEMNRSLLIEAEKEGTEHVLIETFFDNDLFLPTDIARYIEDIRYVPGGSRWIRYYDKSSDRQQFDYVARLNINDVQVSPEQESRKVFVEEKEIEDGEEYVLDNNGNVAKDTLGNDIKQPRFIVVQARVREITREKSLGINAHMEVIGVRSGQRLTEPILANAEFYDRACIIRGDRRAISSQVRKRAKDYPLDFPSDIDLLFQTSEEVKRAFRIELDRMIKRMAV